MRPALPSAMAINFYRYQDTMPKWKEPDRSCVLGFTRRTQDTHCTRNAGLVPRFPDLFKVQYREQSNYFAPFLPMKILDHHCRCCIMVVNPPTSFLVYPSPASYLSLLCNLSPLPQAITRSFRCQKYQTADVIILRCSSVTRLPKGSEYPGILKVQLASPSRAMVWPARLSSQYLATQYHVMKLWY